MPSHAVGSPLRARNSSAEVVLELVQEDELPMILAVVMASLMTLSLLTESLAENVEPCLRL